MIKRVIFKIGSINETLFVNQNAAGKISASVIRQFRHPHAFLPSLLSVR